MMHQTEKRIISKLRAGPLTMNRMALNSQSRPHLERLIDDGYIDVKKEGRYSVLSLTEKAPAEMRPEPVNIVPPRRYFSIEPLVVKQTMAYREGSLSAFELPSLMAHGHQEYKTSLIG